MALEEVLIGLILFGKKEVVIYGIDCSLGVPMAPFLVPTASRGGLWNLVAPFEDGST